MSRGETALPHGAHALRNDRADRRELRRTRCRDRRPRQRRARRRSSKGSTASRSNCGRPGNTTGMAPVADALLVSVKRLRSLVGTVKLEPSQIANGAVELLNEVAGSKITGEEDRYSHTDLWDFEANVEGAQEAFTSVKPIVGGDRRRPRHQDRRAIRGDGHRSRACTGAATASCSTPILTNGADQGARGPRRRAGRLVVEGSAYRRLRMTDDR